MIGVSKKLNWHTFPSKIRAIMVTGQCFSDLFWAHSHVSLLFGCLWVALWFFQIVGAPCGFSRRFEDGSFSMKTKMKICSDLHWRREMWRTQISGLLKKEDYQLPHLLKMKIAFLKLLKTEDLKTHLKNVKKMKTMSCVGSPKFEGCAHRQNTQTRLVSVSCIAYSKMSPINRHKVHDVTTSPWGRKWVMLWVLLLKYTVCAISFRMFQLLYLSTVLENHGSWPGWYSWERSARLSPLFYSVITEIVSIVFTSNISKSELCNTLKFASSFHINVLSLTS